MQTAAELSTGMGSHAGAWEPGSEELMPFRVRESAGTRKNTVGYASRTFSSDSGECHPKRHAVPKGHKCVPYRVYENPGRPTGQRMTCLSWRTCLKLMFPANK